MTTRRRGEARQAILDEARVAFGRDGYQRTSLKDVAAAAEVSMTLIYKYFGSKGGLFEEALIAPARAFIETLLVGWESAGEEVARSVLIEQFVRELHAFVSQNRGLFAAWVEADRNEEPDVLPDGSHGQAMRRLARALAEHGGPGTALPTDQAHAAIACAGGLVLSFVLMDGVLLPAGSTLRDPETQIATITTVACAAIEQRHDSARLAPAHRR